VTNVDKLLDLTQLMIYATSRGDDKEESVDVAEGRRGLGLSWSEIMVGWVQGCRGRRLGNKRSSQKKSIVCSTRESITRRSEKRKARKGSADEDLYQRGSRETAAKGGYESWCQKVVRTYTDTKNKVRTKKMKDQAVEKTCDR